MLAIQVTSNELEIAVKNSFYSLINNDLVNEENYLDIIESCNVSSYILSGNANVSLIIQLLRFSADKNFFQLFNHTLNLFLQSLNYYQNKKAIYKHSDVKKIAFNYSHFLEKFVLQKNNIEFLNIEFFQHQIFYITNITCILKHYARKTNNQLSNYVIEKLQHNIQSIIKLKKFDKVQLTKIENIEFLKIMNVFKILDQETISSSISFILNNNINDPIINQAFIDIDVNDRTVIFNDLLFYIAQNSQNELTIPKVQFLMNNQFHLDVSIKPTYLNNEKVRYVLILQDF